MSDAPDTRLMSEARPDSRAEKILQEIRGKLCIVITITDDGPAFELALSDPTLLLILSHVLRDVADRIDQDLIEAAINIRGES